MASPSPRPVCLNRRARHDYQILDTVEAGLVLTGTEVKSLREGRANLSDAYVTIRAGRPVLMHLEISAYSHDTRPPGQAKRDRWLLMKASEIRKWSARAREAGHTLIPLKIYFQGPWAKVELALARGRRRSDKRQALREREAQREMDRARRRR